MPSLGMHSFINHSPVLLKPVCSCTDVFFLILHKMVYFKSSALSSASTPAATAVYMVLDVYFVSANFLGILNIFSY